MGEQSPLSNQASNYLPISGKEIMTQYQVSYEGQLITDPTDYETATRVAVEENIDAYQQGHEPLAEVVIAPSDD